MAMVVHLLRGAVGPWGTPVDDLRRLAEAAGKPYGNMLRPFNVGSMRVDLCSSPDCGDVIDTYF